MVAPGGTGGGSGTGGGPSLSGGGSGLGGSGLGGNGAATLPGGSGGMAALGRLLPVVVGVTGVVTLMMAFLMFGKRRRDQEPTASDKVLGAAAAMGCGVVASSGLLGSPARVAAVDRPPPPRWRQRRSLHPPCRPRSPWRPGPATWTLTCPAGDARR